FCFSHENHKAKFSCPLANWLEQLSLLCWVAATSTELSSYLDYYDDLQHHSYLHLVPIDVFPRVMPLVVVFVICALFALGLESTGNGSRTTLEKDPPPVDVVAWVIPSHGRLSEETTRTKRTVRSGKRKTKGEYEAVTADDASLLPDRTLSSDSGHSTDTDIDEIVHEYKVNTQLIMKVIKNRLNGEFHGIKRSAALKRLIGLILMVHHDVGATVSTFGAKKTVERLHRLTLQQLPAPRIEIKLHAIQLRNKPVRPKVTLETGLPGGGKPVMRSRPRGGESSAGESTEGPKRGDKEELLSDGRSYGAGKGSHPKADPCTAGVFRRKWPLAPSEVHKVELMFMSCSARLKEPMSHG
ncbi:unnamed protein product, partial [Nesidiocoris tenuis]